MALLKELFENVDFVKKMKKADDKKHAKLPSRQRVDAINKLKPVLSGHSKIDKTKVFKTNGSLMKVESIAECSWSIL